MDANRGSTSSWGYLDFELEIRGGGPREYPVAVRSPAGEARAEMRFPFDEWELKDRLQALEIALLRSGGTRRRIASPEEHTVQDFGRGLFESLLVGDVRTRYEMSLSEARRQGKGLRLKLRILPSELAVLPWEFLYDAERDRYPSLSSNTPLVRYLDLPQPVEPLHMSPPLRVLGMVASPLGLDPLDVEHEKRLVEEATRGLREGGLLVLNWLEGQTWRHLMRAMRRGPWHIFHFVGHGGFDVATEEGAIALANDASHMHLLRARSLAELLDDHYPLRLVFLNSCEGARGSESDAFSSTAATLVRRGVPAVVAMQYEITDRAAIEFSRDFYEALADGLPVDAAVTEARAAVSMDSILEWGTPVLYMHSPDGRIFDISVETRPPELPVEVTGREELLIQYRELVESIWADRKLTRAEVGWLRDHAKELGLSVSDTSAIEREVMDDTKERIFERQEHTVEEEAAKQRYREAVEAAWTSQRLSSEEADRIGDLAGKLSLNTDTAADIEREVMNGTIEETLERQEREDREKQLEGLYARARELHRDRRWQAVIEVFDQIRLEDAAYPDPEGLLAVARKALEIDRKDQYILRQYRERVVSAWADGKLEANEVQRLRDLANNELKLSPNAAADIEREVMGDTMETILERHKHVAREEARQNGLDELYRRARRLHRDEEWRAVVDIFADIHSEDPDYPDPEGLLLSARNSLEMAQKEQDMIRRYREAVEWAWTDEDFNGREAKRLGDLVNKLELSPNIAAQIEREIMSDTKEAILGRREQANAEQYRTAVKEAWMGNTLSNAEAKWLNTLASKLGLNTEIAADIEREVTGATVSAILQRRHRLDELLTQARQSHEDQEWQMVIDIFEHIHSEDPTFSDPEGLLTSAHEALERMRKVASLYDQALRYVDGSEWQQALECFEEVRRLEPGYRDAEELLSRVRRELAPPSTAMVPDLSGQKASQAASALTSKGLSLGSQREFPSDAFPEGQIVEQRPAAGMEVQLGTSVSVTISSGSPTVEVPDLAGRSRDQAKHKLSVASLEIGTITKATNDNVPEGKIVEQRPAAGSEVKLGSPVHFVLSAGSFLDELTRVCAKYIGLGYYVNEAIPEQNLADARSSIPIPPGERVIALVDNSSMLSRGIGLAICGDGIRWRNYAENPVSRKIQGFRKWPEFADVPLTEHRWATEYGIEMGPDNVFVAWKDNTMDQHKLVKLLQDIQSLVKPSISH